MSACAECGTRSQKREYVRVSRYGGGNYRRGGRSYPTTLCDRCLAEALAYFAQADAEGWGARQWQRISRISISHADRRLRERSAMADLAGGDN